MTYPHALADREILEIATAEGRIVLTNDKDFGDLIFRDRLRYEGVILFRLGYVPLDHRIAYLEQILTDQGDHLREVIVVSHRNIRIRRGTSAESPSPPAHEGTGEDEGGH